ncbi:HYC_CC_PP family protein [Robiginitalea biformata]|uniref:HYC_CC_PP family protein n=1 Tax=Robiginitalea TaxID=252306 RepID=UPI003D334DB5
MKRICTKILSIFLTCTVLFTTMSFTANMHYCCSKLVSLSVTGEAKPCDEKLQNPENTPKKCSLEQKNCCSTDSFINIGNDDLKKASSELDSHAFVFLKAFFHSYFSLFQELELKTVSVINHDPPWIERDILILHEVFLI